MIYRTNPVPLFAGKYEIAASSRDLKVRLLRSDGNEITAGQGAVTGALHTTEFGASIELVALEPLACPLDDVRVDVRLAP